MVKPKHGIFKLQPLQMDDKINGTTATGPQGPVHELITGHRDYPPRGAPFGLVVKIFRAPIVLQQCIKVNCSYSIGHFPDFFKRSGHIRCVIADYLKCFFSESLR